MAGAMRGRTEVLGRFSAELEDRHRWERIVLGKAHSEAVRRIERKAGEAYRSGLEGSEERAREAARRDELAVYDRYRGEDWDRLKRSASEERIEQARELYGEGAYERMKRAEERASRPMLPSQYPSREGPERSGPERDYGPSR